MSSRSLPGRRGRACGASRCRTYPRTVAHSLTPALRAVSGAVLSVAAARSVDDVLHPLVHAARELVDARYAALGTPDGEGGFARFLTAGMTDDEITALGPLPRTHGLLGAMLERTES